MKPPSKSNNLIAILIALLLFAAGFIMYFIHQQSEAENHQKNMQTGLKNIMKSQPMPITDKYSSSLLNG